MPTPAQMFDHELNPVKGFSPGQPWTVDFAANMADGETANAGQVVSLNATGEFVAGVADCTSTTAPMPFILFQNDDDFDVLGDDGNLTGVGGAKPMGLAVCQGAEVETTEFDGTPARNALLMAAADGDVTAYTAAATKVVLGVVSAPSRTNEHGKNVLRFHTVYFPVLA